MLPSSPSHVCNCQITITQMEKLRHVKGKVLARGGSDTNRPTGLGGAQAAVAESSRQPCSVLHSGPGPGAGCPTRSLSPTPFPCWAGTGEMGQSAWIQRCFLHTHPNR